MVMDVGAQYSGYAVGHYPHDSCERQIHAATKGNLRHGFRRAKCGASRRQARARYFAVKARKIHLQNVAYNYINSHGKDQQREIAGAIFYSRIGPSHRAERARSIG